MSAAAVQDAHGGLGRALSALFRPAHAELCRSSQRSWASVTFSGARHRFALRVSGERAGEAVERAIYALSAEDFVLEGHVVADIALVERQVRAHDLIEVELEALTVEAN